MRRIARVYLRTSRMVGMAFYFQGTYKEAKQEAKKLRAERDALEDPTEILVRAYIYDDKGGLQEYRDKVIYTKCGIPEKLEPLEGWDYDSGESFPTKERKTQKENAREVRKSRKRNRPVNTAVLSKIRNIRDS